MEYLHTLEDLSNRPAVIVLQEWCGSMLSLNTHLQLYALACCKVTVSALQVF